MADTNQDKECFARCAGGFEQVLAKELRQLGAGRVRPLQGGVSFFAHTETLYRVCLWSRVATRIQMVIGRIQAPDADTLYSQVKGIAWEEWITEGATVSMRAHGTTSTLRNTQFTALKVKDAVCDYLRTVRGARPHIDPHNPDCAIDVSLHGSRATLYFNMSGEALHRRGYREDGVQVQAPLKETLAAGILLAADWPAYAVQGGSFLDPMCGSGTFAIEAALIALGIAPGILRTRWGFEGWAEHDAALWERLVESATQQIRTNVDTTAWSGRIVAGDSNPHAVDVAHTCAQRAGVDSVVALYTSDAAQLLEKADLSVATPGLLVTNPPYGHRLLSSGGLAVVYTALSKVVGQLADNWQVAVITPDAAIDTALGLSAHTVVSCYNGPIEAGVRMYSAGPAHRRVVRVVSLAGVEHEIPVAESSSEQFAARLRKVAKQRAKWARKAGVGCYRVYDADLPDYAIAIDVYQGAGREAGQQFVRMAEYQAPKTIDEARAARRFSDARALVPAILDVPHSHVFAKVRRRAKGGSQYAEAVESSYLVHVNEAGYEFEIDLAGHVDTGLFLDHRDTRMLVGSKAQGKHFLNLFAYTGCASVYAAGGGAASTTTVDLSNTYLAAAKRNMAFNGFTSPEHTFIHADVLDWLKIQVAAGQTYDLVFCDPPTFSNSKRMGQKSFDVQRDHVELLNSTAQVLAPSGLIIFSCNLRSFKIDTDALSQAGLSAQDITSDTIPHDFERTPKIHHCYIVHAQLEA